MRRTDARKVFAVSVLLSIGIVSGCSRTVTVTYYSEPNGAMISSRDGSDLYGMSPARVSYKWDRRQVKNGCLQTPGVQAHWVSGVTRRSSRIIELCGRADAYLIDVERPLDAPGFDQDMHFALEAQNSSSASTRARAAVHHAHAAKQQADAQTLQAIQNAMKQPQAPTYSPQNCTSTVLGNQVFTNCY